MHGIRFIRYLTSDKEWKQISMFQFYIPGINKEKLNHSDLKTSYFITIKISVIFLFIIQYAESKNSFFYKKIRLKTKTEMDR